MILKILVFLTATFFITYTPTKLAPKSVAKVEAKVVEKAQKVKSKIKHWWHKEHNGIKRYPASYETNLKSKVRSISLKEMPYPLKLKSKMPNFGLHLYEIKEENTGTTLYIEVLIDRRNGNLVDKYTHYEVKAVETATTGYQGL